MFDDYLELIPRSQDSAGKSFVKSTYQRNSNYREVYSGGLKTSDAGASQKEAPGGARWAPRHTWARPKVGPRPAMARPPGSTPQVALSRISPPGKPSSGGSSTKYSAASTGRKPSREKELSGREILPGKFPPGEGKSSQIGRASCRERVCLYV